MATQNRLKVAIVELSVHVPHPVLHHIMLPYCVRAAHA